jgi:pimeloyl-ACP methyl ester carboxylesterase
LKALESLDSINSKIVASECLKLSVKVATHALAFLDGLGVNTCDVLGLLLGGMVAQQMALERPSIFRRMILVGTAPRGGEDIMHLEKPGLAKYLNDPKLQGYAVLQKIFFAPTESSQTAGEAFIKRLEQRKDGSLLPR